MKFLENINIKNVILTAIISGIVSYIIKGFLDYILKIIFPILINNFVQFNVISIILSFCCFLIIFMIFFQIIKNINDKNSLNDVSKKEFDEVENIEIIKNNLNCSNNEQNDKIDGCDFEKTKYILDNFEKQFNHDVNNLNWMVQEFFDNFINYINDFTIVFNDDNDIIIGKKICESIENYTPLRNQYIEFLEKVVKFDINELDISIFTNFFNNLHKLTTINGIGSYQRYDFANFDFFLREIFLYTITIALKYQDYYLIKEIFYSPYFFNDEFSENKEPKTFVDLDNRGRFLIDTFLNPYYKYKELNLLSPMADLMIKRIPSNYEIDNIVDSDILCCYISNIHPEKFNRNDWYPFTYVYKQNNYFDFIRKLSSNKHFERTKYVFDVRTIEELKDIIKKNDYKFIKYGYNGNFRHVNQIEYYIDLESIGTSR